MHGAASDKWTDAWRRSLNKDQAITTFGLIVTFAAAAGAHTERIASFYDYQS
jgi:hypothetical protein